VRLFYNLEKMWSGDRPSDRPAAKTAPAKSSARRAI
jgi:hypothetical protein